MPFAIALLFRYHLAIITNLHQKRAKEVRIATGRTNKASLNTFESTKDNLKTRDVAISKRILPQSISSPFYWENNVLILDS